MIDDVLNRVTGMIKRAYVTLVGNDAGQVQTTQVSYLGKTTDMEVIYPYGLFGNPPRGSLALLFSVQGHEENRAGIANLPKQRFKDNKEGEAGVGNLLTGSVIKFLENGDIYINAKANQKVLIEGDSIITVNGSATLDCPGGVTINSNVTINGTVTVSEDVVASGISLVHHVHPGIMPGDATTGEPV